MENCDLFVNFLKGNKSLNYDDFKHLTVEYFSEYITKLYKNYNCKFIISNDFPVYGRCIGVEKIIINEDIIKKIYNGAIGSLLIIFHEISHLEQHIQIVEGKISKNIINYIKDILLKHYQCEQNECFGISDNLSYYELNYSCESSEIDADLNSILLFVKFCLKNEIEIGEKAQQKLEVTFIELEQKKKQARYVGDNIIFNSYYLSLEEAFDFAIKDHPEWLEAFPQLNIEYYIKNGKIIKKDAIDYEGCDNDKSLYSYYLKKTK